MKLRVARKVIYTHSHLRRNSRTLRKAYRRVNRTADSWWRRANQLSEKIRQLNRDVKRAKLTHPI